MRAEAAGGEPSDALLLTASVGDVDRFGELYDRHVDAVLAFHQRRTGCAETAADLTAETFAEAFTSRHRFRDTGAPARAWLFTIARRQLARYLRRERVATRARRECGHGICEGLPGSGGRPAVAAGAPGLGSAAAGA